jgi:hypothetical protein
MNIPDADINLQRFQEKGLWSLFGFLAETKREQMEICLTFSSQKSHSRKKRRFALPFYYHKIAIPRNISCHKAVFMLDLFIAKKPFQEGKKRRFALPFYYRKKPIPGNTSCNKSVCTYDHIDSPSDRTWYNPVISSMLTHPYDFGPGSTRSFPTTSVQAQRNSKMVKLHKIAYGYRGALHEYT